MNSLDIFKKTLSDSAELTAAIDKTLFAWFLPIYFAFTAANALIQSIIPPDILPELSHKSMQIAKHDFLFYLSFFSVSNILDAFFFSTSFLLFVGIPPTRRSFFRQLLLFLAILLLFAALVMGGMPTAIVMIILFPIYFFWTIKNSACEICFLLKTCLSLYSPALLIFPLLFLAVRAGSSNALLMLRMILSLWTLVLFVKVAGAKFSLPVPVIILGFLFGSLGSVFFFYLLKASSLITSEFLMIAIFM